MRKVENRCVDCGLPCLGSRCPNVNAVVYYCDNCGEEEAAEYRIDENELCRECAEKYLMSIFEDLPISEKAEVLKVSLNYI